MPSYRAYIDPCRATLWSICVPSLVLIAHAFHVLERGQIDRQTDATERPILAGGYTAGVGNNDIFIFYFCKSVYVSSFIY